MFTGIIEGQALVESITPRGAAYRLDLDLGPLAAEVKIGDSVAIDGACLTVVTVCGPKTGFDVIRETVERTAFAALRVHDKVNVELSMRAGGRFHGHIVSGHIDGAGTIKLKREEGGQVWLEVSVSPRLTTYMIEKGSVTIDGVSLTLTAVEESQFAVALIPHTLGLTTLGTKTVGSLVNIEVDQLGKWVRRLLTAYMPESEDKPPAGKILDPRSALGLTLEELRRTGFAE